MFFESFLLNLTVIIVLILALIFDYVTKYFSYWYVRHISYKYPVPFIGSDYHRVLGLRSTTDEVEKLCQRFTKKQLVGSIRSRIPDLIVKDAEIIKLILSTESKSFNSRGLCLDRTRDVCLRNNLFYAEGSKWDLLKKNLESILESRTQKFEQNETGTNKYLRDVNGEINARNFLENIMDGVIKDLVFGEASYPEAESIVSDLRSHLGSMTIVNKLKSYLKSIFPSIYILFGLNTLHLQSNRKLRQTLKTSDLIKETKNISFEYSSLKDEKKSKNQGDSETDIAFSLLSSFITEGYIPCLNTIICLLYELSKDQEIQNKARKSTEGYIENIIKETMRLYPPYSIITRKCIRTFKFPDSDLLLDKGVTITVPISVIHKDPKYYENPEVFNPDRFSKEIEKDRPECAYIPYGVGPRQCIGQKLSQLIITRVTESILRKYRIGPSPRTPSRLTFKDHNFSRMLGSQVWLRFEPIESTN